MSSSTPVQTHKFRLTGLSRGTRYYYKVRSIHACGESVSEYSNIYSFTTPDNRKENFTVVLFNDLHSTVRPVEVDTFLKKMTPYLPASYDLIVYNGDIFDEVTDERYIPYWLGRFVKFTNNSEIPSVFLAGNHEYDNITTDADNDYRNMALKKYIDFVRDGIGYGMIRLGQTQFLFMDIGHDSSQAKLKEDHDERGNSEDIHTMKGI